MRRYDIIIIFNIHLFLFQFSKGSRLKAVGCSALLSLMVFVWFGLVWFGLVFYCLFATPRLPPCSYSLLLLYRFFFFIFLNYLSSFFPPAFQMLILKLTFTQTVVHPHTKEIHISHLSSLNKGGRFIQLVKVKMKCSYIHIYRIWKFTFYTLTCLYV